MNHPAHAMDFIFQTRLGTYPLAAQCEMLAELGYQGLTVSWWSQELVELPRVKERWGLDVGAIYVIYRQGLESRLVRLFESVEGCGSIELALHSGESVTDADRRMLDRLLPICERRNIELVLYPHIRYGMQTTSEAVSLCKEFDHPRLGIVFNGYHWYATQEKALEQRLDALWPWLRQVNIAGCRLSPAGLGRCRHHRTPGRGGDGQLRAAWRTDAAWLSGPLRLPRLGKHGGRCLRQPASLADRLQVHGASPVAPPPLGGDGPAAVLTPKRESPFP